MIRNVLEGSSLVWNVHACVGMFQVWMFLEVVGHPIKAAVFCRVSSRFQEATLSRAEALAV